jgi:hypothetical protein
VPEAGLGVLVPGQAGDTGGTDNQAVPRGVELAGDLEGFNPPGFMTAMAFGLDTLEAVGRRLVGGPCLKRGQQARLVGLDLGEQSVAAVAGNLKGFFGNARRQR